MDNPIDTTQWESDPCAVIAAEQFSAAGFPSEQGERKTDNTGQGCSWSWIDELSGLSGTFFTGTKDGLSHFYAQKAEGTLEAFEPLAPIEGHPAVIALTEDLREQGKCTVDVGLRDDLLYTVQMTADSDSRWYDDPCKAAQELATLAVQTMKGGA